MSYLALHWMPGCDETRAAATAAIRAIQAFTGWPVAGEVEGLVVLASDRVPVRRWGATGYILGEIYQLANGRAVLTPDREPGDAEQPFSRLTQSVFGRFVALDAGRHPGAFRDPSGALDCLVWVLGPLTFIGSDFALAPPGLRPPRLRLDWRAIARCMGSASASTVELGFTGLQDVAPGVWRSLSAPDRSALIWSPTPFVQRERRTNLVDLADELRVRVDLAVRALVGSRDQVAVEVSGGLDSAITAGTIASLGLRDRVGAWLNYSGARPEGDERAYAKAVTDRIGVRLDVVDLPIRPLMEQDFAEVARSPRPPMNALVPMLDRETTDRVRTAGATALVSGQGGDAVFYQMPTSLVLADEIAARGPGILFTPMLADVARMLRRSTWRVAHDALGARPQAVDPPRTVAALKKSEVRVTHPWVQAAEALAPAKALQVAGLANAHVATGSRRLTRSAELLYPLFAQPVVEFCLGVPAATLQHGGRERALARLAFSDRLPPSIVARRKKGELTAFHAQTVAASLSFLRPHLLDGCLAEAGVVDRRRLEAALQPAHLLRYAGGGEILVAAALESWVRHWQRYVPDDPHGGREQVALSAARYRSSQRRARA